MSLILDALRKSEAERRRGQVPDLRAELPPLVRASASPRRRWPVWFAGSAALLAAAALGWSVWVSRPPMPADASAAIAPGIDPAPTRQADPSPETSPALPQAPRPLPSAAVRAAPPQPQPARPVADAAYATAPSTPSREITAATPTAPPSMPAPAPEAESVPAVAEASRRVCAARARRGACIAAADARDGVDGPPDRPVARRARATAGPEDQHAHVGPHPGAALRDHRRHPRRPGRPDRRDRGRGDRRGRRGAQLARPTGRPPPPLSGGRLHADRARVTIGPVRPTGVPQ